MKNFFLIAAATQVLSVKIQSETATENEALVDASGESNRGPILEKVVNELSADLQQQIPDSVPEGMDRLLCDFETEGSKEWDRLGCER
jgi:hypothetical protein